MRRTVGFAGWVFAGAAFALAACNNSYGGNTIATPGPPCPVPSSFVLVNPAANATGVPDNTTNLYFAVSAPFAQGNSFQLVVSGPAIYGAQGSTIPPAQINANAVPSPAATPPYANPVYYTVSVPPLPGQSSFTVFWNDAGTNCTPTGAVGSFTTL